MGPVAGLLTVAAGVAAAALHGMATITFQVDHIVSGVAINILAIGIPRFLSIVVYDQPTQSPQVLQLPKIDLPGLGEVSLMVPVTILLGVASWFVLNRTVFGLRLRSAGENPGPPRASASGSRASAGPASSSPARPPAWPVATSPSSWSASTARA